MPLANPDLVKQYRGKFKVAKLNSILIRGMFIKFSDHRYMELLAAGNTSI